ncbi:ubiquitin elongating factor core-domain-containing protein [Microdochium trichocladiopsis]|uniref:Ubiquitin elongating factor core-domain-containing protein n=1 Tax=Microdochium trichocladiopsis TaxID=1682393 RepID=A0A9P8YI44_9PEZI|nr:ubiquitin elongating factor core-domain-containing protein [Microdochium trichocladiopsis]KAH7040368.1 ubiquitin elongating factor core-domain-containing protein [Microdochium trichocladiopsis]
MRQRRLAKLAAAGGATGSPSSPTPSDRAESPRNQTENENAAASSSSLAQPVTKINTPSTAGSSGGNPFNQLGVKKKPENGAGAPPPKKVQVSKEETLEDWSDRTLSDIFRVTVNQDRSTDSRGSQLISLPELRADLEESGEPLKLSASSLDSALLEAARHVPTNMALLDYFLPCWKRILRALKAARKPTPEREEVLREAKRLCMSNSIFALTMPEYFGRDANPAHDSLAPFLLRNHENDDGICLDFFEEAVSRIPEDDTIEPVFTEAMVQLSQRLATMTMNDDYKPYINCLITYSKFPPLLDALARHPRFLVNPTPGMTKEQIATATETQTILGPFFRISPLQPEVTKSYFASPRTLDQGHKKSAQSSLQMTLKAHLGDLTGIINQFIRAKGPETRSRVLEWFAFIFNTNHKRRALQVKANEVAADGLMVNVTVVLDKLCEPFMDSTFSKMDRIDIDYLRRSPRVDMSDETKLNADQATADAYYGTKVEGTSNFISEVFFLALAAHHYGLGATNAKLKTLDREIKHIEKVVKEMDEQMVNLQGDPLRRALAQRHHHNAVEALEKALSLKYSIEGVVLDDGLQTSSLQFMRYVSVWLLRTASGTNYLPGQKMKLPLSAQKPEAFSCLPEYALQDVVDNLRFIFQHVPKILVSAVGDEIITLCITFLRSSEYIKNPYLKSSLVTLLFSGTWPMYHLSRGILGDSLIGSEFANEHLLHTLIKFYIECEHSGVSSAFYDKFNIRYEIFQVIKCIWTNGIYKEQLSKESRVNRQFFVQFVNLLLNDTTYALDEALRKLYKIHDYQKQLKGDLSPEEREKILTDLEQDENFCQSWMQQVNETMAMMKMFTAALRDAFTMPEIVVRLANMLDYNLEVLVGPRRANLKVEDPKKYHFDAKALLSDFIDIYLNLGSKPAFVEAVAADGRSYKPENFSKASQILSANLHAAPETAAAWDALRTKFAEEKVRLDQAELDLGDIPDEFEDPLMGDLMSDPVILPSQNIVDRSTIVQQLLSNPLDPFTRSPMTIDDVVPADELRERIMAWKAERIEQARAKAAEAAGSMDTSED